MPTAEQIRAARSVAQESQAVFGERFGVHQSTIHRWETDGPPTRGPVALFIDQVLAACGGRVGRTKNSSRGQRVGA